jgi:cysteine desulfurase
MSEKQEKWGDKSIERGYQPKIDKPPGKPPVGGSNVKPPPSPKEDKK